MSNDLITLRAALILLQKPHKKEDVRALRRKLQRREAKNGARILTPEPYRISMTALRAHVPELFVDVENVVNERIVTRISKALRGMRGD